MSKKKDMFLCKHADACVYRSFSFFLFFFFTCARARMRIFVHQMHHFFFQVLELLFLTIVFHSMASGQLYREICVRDLHRNENKYDIKQKQTMKQTMKEKNPFVNPKGK